METINCDPNVNNSYYNDKLQYSIYDNLIFVFGSNLAGRHGKGAALTARLDYGAIQNLGSGLMNRSYAIPTKDERLNVLPLSVINLYVKQFIKFTKLTNKQFFVTPIGTGLANYSHEQIAPMFKGVRNCWLPYSWKEYLEGENQ